MAQGLCRRVYKCRRALEGKNLHELFLERWFIRVIQGLRQLVPNPPLAIMDGSGSWRTRHLRMRASLLSDLVGNSNNIAEHCSGLKLAADLLA